MKHDSLIVEYHPVGPFAMNSYVIGCAATRQGAIIDSGGECQHMLGLARQHELDIAHLLQTHAHVDHVAGLREMKTLVDKPIYLHPADRPIYDAAAQMGQFFGLRVDPPPPVDETLEDGQLIPLGELTLRVLHTPGHCPGHVGFYCERVGVFFGGDLLFSGSIGRIDLPGASPDDMRRSLQRILDELPEDTVVYPGHMQPTSIGRERRVNPFLNGAW